MEGGREELRDRVRGGGSEGRMEAQEEEESEGGSEESE